MNVYIIYTEYQNSDCETKYNKSYIGHEKEYTREEFNKICKECLLKYDCKNEEDLEENLIENYGFKEVGIQASFDW